MAKKLRPTGKELAILQVLWEKGPSTVRQVNDILSRKDGTGYTTTLKLMQIMYEKGLVRRDESSRTHVYTPVDKPEKVENQIVGNMLDQVFSGSTERLVMRAISSKKVTSDELRRIREFLDNYEKGKS